MDNYRESKRNQDNTFYCSKCNTIFSGDGNPKIACRKCSTPSYPFKKTHFPNFLGSDKSTNATVEDLYKSVIADKISYAKQKGFGPINIDISSGYFDFGAWNIMKDSLKAIDGKIRILLGTAPVIYDNRKKNKNIIIKEFKNNFIKDIEEVSSSDNVQIIIKEFIEWLDEPNVEIKLYTHDFLHSKTLYIYSNNNSDINTLFVGSANFTKAGLTSNKEAIAALNHYRTSSQHSKWFNSIWLKSEPLSDYSVVYNNLYSGYNQHQIYSRMIEALFRSKSTDIKDYDSGINERWLLGLSDFQKDAAIQSYMMLQSDKHNGVLITDEVGLGKTHIAGALIKKYYDMGARSLVIAPASIRDNVWKSYIEKNSIDTSRVKVISFDEARKIETQGFDISDYSLLIIDEAHYIKESSSVTYKTIETEILPLMSSPKIVLLTATPINNTIMDLYNLIKLYVVDNQILGIESLYEKFKSSQAEDPKEINWEWIEVLLKEVSIHRTRKAIKDKYPELEIGGKKVSFPKNEKTNIINYDFSEESKHLYTKVLSDITNANIKFAAYGGGGSGREPSGINFAKTVMLKMAESSLASFKSNVYNLMEKTKIAIDDGTIESSPISSQEEQEDELGEVEGLIFESKELDNLKATAEATMANLQNDKLILEHWIELINNLERDDKLDALMNNIAAIAAMNEGSDFHAVNRRKIVIFTSYKVTAKYLYDNIKEIIKSSKIIPYTKDDKVKIGLITGDNKNERTKILKSFAPMSMDSKIEYEDSGTIDILITTDVLAEGVNLQQSSIIINYDMPWNPMRLVQRMGRIDRLFSYHDEIKNYCMHMSIESNKIFKDMLRLNEILSYKMMLANTIMGHKDATGLLNNTALTPEKIRELEIDSKEKNEMLKQWNSINERSQEIESILNGESIEKALEKHDSAFLENWSKSYIKDKDYNTIVPFGSGAIGESEIISQATWVFCFEIDAFHEISKKKIKMIRFVTYENEKSHYHEENYDSWKAIQISKPYSLESFNRLNVSKDEHSRIFNIYKPISKTISKKMVSDNKLHNEGLDKKLSPSSTEVARYKKKLYLFLENFEESNKIIIKSFIKNAALEHHIKYINKLIENSQNKHSKSLENKITNYIIHRNLNVDQFGQKIHFSENDIKLKYWMYLKPMK